MPFHLFLTGSNGHTTEVGPFDSAEEAREVANLTPKADYVLVQTMSFPIEAKRDGSVVTVYDEPYDYDELGDESENEAADADGDDGEGNDGANDNADSEGGSEDGGDQESQGEDDDSSSSLSDTPVTYEDLTNAELSDILRERDLPTSGTKDQLVARLIESDNNHLDQPEDV